MVAHRRRGLSLLLLLTACGAGVRSDPSRPDVPRASDPPADADTEDCVLIQWCQNPNSPYRAVFCQTDVNPACSDVDRVFDCERKARMLCGANHARPIHYVPPIAGRTTAYPPTLPPDAGRSDSR